MTTRWYEISLPIPSDLTDEAAALLDLAGFGGVEIRDPSTAAASAEVVVVVETDDLAQKIATARSAVEILGAGEPRTKELDPKVWTENWKRHFARRTFAGRIEVRPPWEAPPADTSGLVSLVINPGMAFGTGLHETTAACLELLAGEVRAGMNVADVGCGSGILAIAAARLGAGSVLATDVDPLAIEATTENALANAVADIVRTELEPGEVGIPQWESHRPGLTALRSDEPKDVESATIHGASRTLTSARVDERKDDSVRAGRSGSVRLPTPPEAGFAAYGQVFDLVVANILAETLVELQPALAGAVREGGVIILSGIESRRLKIVEDAFIRSPWCLARTVTKGDWVSLSLHHFSLAEPERTPSVPV